MRIGIESNSEGLIFFNNALFGFFKNMYIRKYEILNSKTSRVSKYIIE